MSEDNFLDLLDLLISTVLLVRGKPQYLIKYLTDICLESCKVFPEFVPKPFGV